MNPLRRLLSLFTPRPATEPVQTTVVALAPESTIRPWSADELRAIDGLVNDMHSLPHDRVQPCTPAPEFDAAMERVYRDRPTVYPRKQALRKAASK